MKKALVLSLAMVFALGVASFAQTLSGSWDTTVTIDPVVPSIAIESELIVTYAVSGWSFSSDTVLTDLGWTKQHFDVSGTLGAFTLGSVLTFTPAPVPAFTKWVVTGGLSLTGVTFDGTFTLTPGNTKFEIVGAGTAGLVDVEVDVTFGDPTVGTGCDFNWQGVDITIDFPFDCAMVTSVISFDCDGFNEVTFEVTGIAIPALPWVTLDALLTFQTGSKTLVLTPNFDFGAFVCFDLYITQAVLDVPYITLGNITIEGIGLEVEFGGVMFTGISWWGVEETSGLPGGYPFDLKPGLLNGTPYWEAYQIATTDDGCCGPFGFDVTVYFLDAGMLFDVAEVDANMSIQIATQFTFSMGIDIGVVAPAFTNWELGFKVEW